MKTTRTLIALLAVASTVSACRDEAPPSIPPEVATHVDPFRRPEGYWEGGGKLRKNDDMDRVRKLSRSADFTFWFTLYQDGTARGEIDVTYDALLNVDLSSVGMTVPAPGGLPTPLWINPKVGGHVTDPDPSRRYPIVGRFENGSLILAAEIADDAAPIEFSLMADPGVMGGSANGFSLTTMPITPFSPLGDTPVQVVRRPRGPHAARQEIRTDKVMIEWAARQITFEIGIGG